MAELYYGDGEIVELGDICEVNDSEDEFEPEEAKVIKLGLKRIQVELTNELITNRKEWVSPENCELVCREF